MRKVSTLVGLTLFALAGMARAQEAAPGAADPAPPVGDAASTPAPAAASAAPHATEAVASTPASTTPVVPRKKIQVGLSFLPMAAGTFTSSPGGQPKAADAAFAYGFGLTACYEVLRGLLVGIAPQLIYSVKGKTDPTAAKQLDLMLRVAYAYQLLDGISVYAEGLGGYSKILAPVGDSPAGLVLAFGAGGAMDLTDRIFANLGLGYEKGFQNRTQDSVTLQTRTQYVRVTLGGGVKF